MQELPVRHILFEDKWEKYTEALHILQAELKEKEVDNRLLDECLEAAFELADLSVDEAFVTGYEKGRKNGINQKSVPAPSRVG
ncbi:hypothetical protein [Alteribacillus iranensis]|uniref:Uncharacterized protein n=1 Tax=Alteribacillus iranensis TaxID=930128 RepID=A0A1I2B4X6_9BACI|nr:hypothetical protein [Alteribacillus iranensis]SFE50343.1 hypothetical protein SAMN05192532_10246 [Alteribacillus iranensis]